MFEVFARFGSTPERKAILVGLLGYRQALRDRGLIEGFQWIDGKRGPQIAQTLCARELALRRGVQHAQQQVGADFFVGT